MRQAALPTPEARGEWMGEGKLSLCLACSFLTWLLGPTRPPGSLTCAARASVPSPEQGKGAGAPALPPDTLQADS